MLGTAAIRSTSETSQGLIQPARTRVMNSAVISASGKLDHHRDEGDLGRSDQGGGDANSVELRLPAGRGEEVQPVVTQSRDTAGSQGRRRSSR